MNYIVKKKKKRRLSDLLSESLQGVHRSLSTMFLQYKKVSSAPSLNKRVISPMRLWAVPQRQGMGAGLI